MSEVGVRLIELGPESGVHIAFDCSKLDSPVASCYCIGIMVIREFSAPCAGVGIC